MQLTNGNLRVYYRLISPVHLTASNRQFFVKKLGVYGFDDIATEWVRSYLSDRQQFVQFANQTSPTLTIIVGAPQGSCLSPLFFIILIADISEWASIALIEGFADDISATIIDDSPQKVIAKLEKASTNILKFMASNSLVANDSKTSFILFGSRTTGTPPTHIKVGHAMIKEQSTIKLLGSTIMNDLKWTEHTEQVLNQMNHRLFLFKHIRDLLPEHTIPTVADPLVTSHIRYAMQLFVTPRLSIYEPQTSISKKFQIVQNNVTRAWIKAKRIDKKNMKIARSDLRTYFIRQPDRNFLRARRNEKDPR